MGATLGDSIKVYVKPSLDGTLVIRKRGSRQTSTRLKAVQDKMAATKSTSNAPSVVAHNACEAAGKTRSVRVYKPGTGYQDKKVCPIKDMKSFLKKATKNVVGGS